MGPRLRIRKESDYNLIAPGGTVQKNEGENNRKGNQGSAILMSLKIRAGIAGNRATKKGGLLITFTETTKENCE